MKKTVVALILCFAMCFGLIGCSESDITDNSNVSNNVDSYENTYNQDHVEQYDYEQADEDTYENTENDTDTACERTESEEVITSIITETMVWIPTNGGTKYHTRSGCSNMKNPEQVTKSEAIILGFEACKKCH